MKENKTLPFHFYHHPGQKKKECKLDLIFLWNMEFWNQKVMIIWLNTFGGLGWGQRCAKDITNIGSFNTTTLCVCYSLSCVWHFETTWTVVHQAPPSMEFSRQEYWSGLPCPSPGDLLDPGIELRSPALAGRFFTIWPTREALKELCQVTNLWGFISQMRKPRLREVTWPS